ncbi:hypothetical protein CAPTEDRAFT_186760 [Capitella teleta]|uniref:Uncharacterized protein n=1 Tax=Capitella teleta TaxID=283909 RepID=R7T9L2_CAPTE|nr:hypothetical protein CAPTEDRAFT_186760 [Capitella teleta]|eukprot:ELT90207.1 hypothetical protein CAPTEDRAFT_186760 [Capitella teleta]
MANDKQRSLLEPDDFSTATSFNHNIQVTFKWSYGVEYTSRGCYEDLISNREPNIVLYESCFSDLCNGRMVSPGEHSNTAASYKPLGQILALLSIFGVVYLLNIALFN